MENQIHILHHAQLNRLVETASQFPCAVQAYDRDGNMANVKSILGMMRLNLTSPIQLQSENAAALRILMRSFNS